MLQVGQEKRVLRDTGSRCLTPTPVSVPPLSPFSVAEIQGRDRRQRSGWLEGGPSSKAHLLPTSCCSPLCRSLPAPLQGLGGRAADSPGARHRRGWSAVRRGSPGTPPCPLAPGDFRARDGDRLARSGCHGKLPAGPRPGLLWLLASPEWARKAAAQCHFSLPFGTWRVMRVPQGV